MELRYHLPRPELREYVRGYYYFSTDVAVKQPMCAELGNIRIVLDGSGAMILPNGEKHVVSEAHLLGPTMANYQVLIEPKSRLFGIGMRPRGWLTPFGVSAMEMADRVYDLSAVIGNVAQYGIDEVGNAADLPSMAAGADRFFADVLGKRRPHKSLNLDAFEHWLLDASDPSLDDLVDILDVSRRQTDRIAKQAFGASPKLLQRKYRALRAADRIQSGETDWAAAAGSSYYDQSHFIKEFRHFIGVTPHQFVANEAVLIKQIQAKRRQGMHKLPLASV